MMRKLCDTHTLALAGITVLGTCLRLVYLGRKSYWFDEIATIRISHLSFPAFRSVLWQFEANMAFYYLLVRPWIYFGDSELWVRLLSAISGVACIPLMYVLGTRIESQKAGIASALLFSINVAAIAYSQEARSYSLLLLLCLVSLLCFLRIRNGSTGTILIYAMASALAVYAHFFAIFFLFAQWLSVLSQRPSGIRELPWRKYLAAIFLTTCLISPALYYMAFRRSGQLAYIPRPHLHDLSQLLYFLTADEGKYRKPIALLYLLCCGVAVRRLVLRLRTRDSSPQNTGQILVILCAVLPIVVTFLISFWIPIFFPRYLLICLPPLVLLAGLGLAAFPSWARSGLVLVMIALSAGCVIWYYGHPNDDWRALTAYVLKHAEPGDVIVGCPPGAEWPVQYYSAAMNSGKPPQFSYLTAPRLLQKLHSASNSARRFWVVAWGDNPDAKAMPLDVAPEYERIAEQDFPGVLSTALYARIPKK